MPTFIPFLMEHADKLSPHALFGVVTILFLKNCDITIHYPRKKDGPLSRGLDEKESGARK